MTDTTTAWAEVGDHLSAFCLKLKLHAEEELSDEEVAAKSGLDKLRAAIDEAVAAAQEAYEDEAVRSDARAVGRSVVDAIDVTLRDVRERFSSAKG